MASDGANPLNDVLQADEAGILQQWIDGQINAAGFRSDRITPAGGLGSVASVSCAAA